MKSPKRVRHAGPTVAVPRADDHFVERHDTFLRLIREDPIDVLFLGDSITRRWAESPAEWQRWFGSFRAANFGVGGDCVENLLWRIQNGELESISPRVVILLIGTNNLPVHRPEDVASGISIVVSTIRRKLPCAKILLLGLFPRGPQNPSNASTENPYYQDAVEEVNRTIEALDDGTRVRFLDVGHGFLDADGEINPELMPDLLHPVTAGFHVFGSLIRPVLDEMVAEPTVQTEPSGSYS